MSSRQFVRLNCAVALAALGAAGCASYEPAPIDPVDVLKDLDKVGVGNLGVAWVSSGSFKATDGLSREEAVSVAFKANPSLRTLRRELAVSEARLVEAGLLPDPVIGWDAMDVVADFSTDGKSTSSSYLAGFSLSWAVPRPGEIGAKEAIARAEILAKVSQIRTSQWKLSRSVRQAYLDLLVIRSNLQQTTRLKTLADRTVQYFKKARAAGAATALQETLARVSLGGLEAREIELQGQELLARQALNSLLGLPPLAAWQLQTTLAAHRAPSRLKERTPRELVKLALKNRPDLKVALAKYQQAEARLQLEITRQWPQISIGTGIGIELPFFSRFNQPAITTARHARDAARASVREVVYRIRAAVHRAFGELMQSHKLLLLYRGKLLPQAERTLELTRRAFKAREVTLVEILTAQSQVLQTQSRFQASRGRWAAGRLNLDFAVGQLPLPPETKRSPKKESR